MVNPKTTAQIVAILFLIATIASIAAAVYSDPILQADDFLGAVHTGAMPMAMSVFLMLVAAVSIVGIPIALYPVFRRYSETAALWFLGMRMLEAFSYVMGAVFTAALIPLAHRAFSSGMTQDPAYQDLGYTMRAAGDAAFNFGPSIFFSVSAMILAVILYQTRLVPRWLSVWKLIGGALFLLQGTLILFDAATPMIKSTLFLPIAVNEMVLAVWLLTKGFNRAAFDRVMANV